MKEPETLQEWAELLKSEPYLDHDHGHTTVEWDLDEPEAMLRKFGWWVVAAAKDERPVHFLGPRPDDS